MNHTLLHSKSGHPTLPFLFFSWHWTVSSVINFTLAVSSLSFSSDWLPKHASLLHFGLIWNIWSMCNLWVQNVTNSRITLPLLSWHYFNSGYSLTSPPTVGKPWKELTENVAFVFKCPFYLDLFPMSSCLKQSLSALCARLRQLPSHSAEKVITHTAPHPHPQCSCSIQDEDWWIGFTTRSTLMSEIKWMPKHKNIKTPRRERCKHKGWMQV